ncbi:STAS domain-containing protein [Psychromarinibacter sp. C21-152]|uniref:Anti-sigma factor antagonist n=1 Tax=Psychromarinibacter sediminicola TaxID=3033385 RepID=A0AAE3NRE6_9RHOB|nr:STAS domain-containing protein [Psychromarinibacter sediminicola]MDF0600671.1 STAS domain-containing protein [Psychromarinibacter sediminicola]
MRLETETVGGTRLIRVCEPRIDAASAVEFKDAFRDCAADAPGRVVLDLGQVEFLDSSGLGAVVAAMKLLAPDRRLDLAAPRGKVEKVFRLTRMDTVFVIHPDVATAMDATADAP